MAGWADLPHELRLTIWEDVAADFNNGPPKFSSFATVCRQWQEYFETRNFESLSIQQDDVADFGRVIQADRLSHIRHLRLHIRLPDYNCVQSDRPEGLDAVLVHEIIFTNSLCSLMDIIATLETTLNLADQVGFTLELSASSPSDSKHGFWNHFRLSDEYDKRCRRYPRLSDEPFMEPQSTSLVRGCTSHHVVDTQDVERVHGFRPLELRLKPTGLQTPKPPRVINMITGLLTRRQYFRSISTSALSFLTRNCLPRIAKIRIERWQKARLGHSQADGFLKELLHYSMSRELQSLDIFEDRSPLSQVSEVNDLYRPTDDLAVSEALWRVCHTFPKLQNFSACSIIDASDFFSHFSDSFAEMKPWPELKTLCLTARDLMRQTSTPSFNIENERLVWKLLTNATEVANLMPKLEVIELWHAEMDMACIWTYYKMEDYARIVVRGGHVRTALGYQPEAVQRLVHMAQTWSDYASELFDRKVTCEVLLLPGDDPSTHDWGWGEWRPATMYSPRDIVQHLELAGVILHPTTLHQMKWESQHEPYNGEPYAPEPALPQEKSEAGDTEWGYAPGSVGADTGDDQSDHGDVLWGPVW